MTSASVPGPDILLSPAAEDIYPFVIECKNKETLNIWAALAQADAHGKNKPLHPIVFFKRNHSKLYCAIEAERFLKLVR